MSLTIRLGRRPALVRLSSEAERVGEGRAKLLPGLLVFGLCLLAFTAAVPARSLTIDPAFSPNAVTTGLRLAIYRSSPAPGIVAPRDLAAVSLNAERQPRSSAVSQSHPIAREMEPLVRFVRPLGQGSVRGLRWGFLAGAGAGTAVAAVLASRKSSNVVQLSAALGTWVGSMLTGFLIGRLNDPVVAQTTWPPLVDLKSSFADADGSGTLSGDEDGRLQISITNRGKGRAKNVRLGVALLESGIPVKSNYRGGTLLGSIDGDCDRRVTILVRPQSELPRNRFTIGVTCSYETEWGAEATATQRVVVTSAPRSLE